MPLILRPDARSSQSLMRAFVLCPGTRDVEKRRNVATVGSKTRIWYYIVVLSQWVEWCADLPALRSSICALHLIQQQQWGSFPLNRGCKQTFKRTQLTDAAPEGFAFHLATNAADAQTWFQNSIIIIIIIYNNNHLIITKLPASTLQDTEPSSPFTLPSFISSIPALVLASSASPPAQLNPALSSDFYPASASLSSCSQLFLHLSIHLLRSLIKNPLFFLVKLLLRDDWFKPVISSAPPILTSASVGFQKLSLSDLFA